MSDTSIRSAYDYLINHDFDIKKAFEDNVLNILNNYLNLPCTYPQGYEDFDVRYRKVSDKCKTVFVDIDETLLFLNLFPADGKKAHEIVINKESGDSLKVNSSSSLYYLGLCNY